MGLYKNLYTMSLVGATAGLCSWVIVELLSPFLKTSHGVWFSDLVSLGILGAVLGAWTMGLGDDRRTARGWTFAGGAIGLVSGLLAATMQIPITRNLAPQAPLATRVVAWLLAGSVIGLGLGLLSVKRNPLRGPYAFLGGLLGGAAAGLLFASFGGLLPDFVPVIGFMLTGMGICFGLALAPLLVQHGILEFISSGDPRAQSKLRQSDWPLEQQKSYVIGSLGGRPKATPLAAENEIFIPDQAIAARHAILTGRQGRFYISRHPETSGQAGLGKYVLRVRGRTVTRSQELRNADDILIGRTALKFLSRPGTGPR